MSQYLHLSRKQGIRYNGRVYRYTWQFHCKCSRETCRMCSFPRFKELLRATSEMQERHQRIVAFEAIMVWALASADKSKGRADDALLSLIMKWKPGRYVHGDATT